jgi:hypothetical protein
MNVEEAGAGCPSEQRLARRARVLLRARVHAAAGAADAWIRDVSSGGALLSCERGYPVGTDIVVTRGESAVPGEVAWSEQGRIGVRFKWRIDESAVLVQQPGPVQVDGELYRRPSLRSTRPLTDEERHTIEVWGGA